MNPKAIIRVALATMVLVTVAVVLIRLRDASRERNDVSLELKEKRVERLCATISTEVHREVCRKWGIDVFDVSCAVEDFVKRPSFQLSELRKLKIKASDGKTELPLEELAAIDVSFVLKEQIISESQK